MPLRFDLHLLTTLLTLISSASITYTDSSINTVEEFLDTLINSSRYDRRIRPFFDQHSESASEFPSSIVSLLILEACNVTMTIHINTISAINEVNMDYNTDLLFRQSWYDPRLNYSGTDWAAKAPQITLHYSLIDRIWVPDSFFRNAKEGKRSDITVPNRLIRIHRDGKVLYSQRSVFDTHLTCSQEENLSRFILRLS